MKIKLYVGFATSGFYNTDYGLFDLAAKAVDTNGNKYTVYWNFEDDKEIELYDRHAKYRPVYTPALITNNKYENVTSQCIICN